MAVIYYGLSGDGRGHATRVQTIVEALRNHHRVVIYAPLDAFEMLAPMYAGSDVEVRSIPGLRMCYNAANRVHYVRSAMRTASYVGGLPELLRRLRADMEREQPDLVISDFDPALPWAAQKLHIPVISLDHQHLMATSDLRGFPWRLRMYAAAVGPTALAFGGHPVATIVSSFAFPPLRRRHGHVHQVGVLLRKEVLKARPETKPHLVAYFRRFAPASTLDTLAASPLPVWVYGTGEHPRRGALRFKRIDSRGFIDDLASSSGLICTAGNQLVGEALHLGKPICAMPEAANYEQSINARLLDSTGAGMTCRSDRFDSDTLKTFLSRLEQYTDQSRRLDVMGNARALEIIESHLPVTSELRRAAA